jgi:hypothetical protein
MADQNYSDTCIFCRLAKGLVRADIIFQDDDVIAYNSALGDGREPQRFAWPDLAGLQSRRPAGRNHG